MHRKPQKIHTHTPHFLIKRNIAVYSWGMTWLPYGSTCWRLRAAVRRAGVRGFISERHSKRRPGHLSAEPPPVTCVCHRLHLLCWLPVAVRAGGQGSSDAEGWHLVLRYSSLSQSSPRCSWEPFVYICELSECDMEVARGDKSGTLKCRFYSHISNPNCPLKLT